MTTQDKLGVYRVGDLKFYSKLEAIEMHTKTGIHPHWDFNEAVFSCYDWTKEPLLSLQELYKIRALQLRKDYDYIILNYSGGADSQTILDTFVDNNILLDEVFTFTNSESSGNTDDLHNYEVFHYAIPFMKKLNESQTWPKHRVLDNSQSIADFQSSTDGVDWIYRVNMIWQPTVNFFPNLVMSVTEWRQLMDQGKRVCVLYGTDKPRLVYEDGRFAVRFIDIAGFTGSVPVIANELPYSTEYFYWTPDLPELIIKQAHIVKNYLNSGDVKTLPFITGEKTDLAYKIVDGQKYWLNFVGLHNLIYPAWNRHNRPNSHKPTQLLYNLETRSGGSEKEYWFYRIETTNEFRKKWEIGYEHLWNQIPMYWRNDPANQSAGVKASVSKNYFLE